MKRTKPSFDDRPSTSTYIKPPAVARPFKFLGDIEARVMLAAAPAIDDEAGATRRTTAQRRR